MITPEYSEHEPEPWQKIAEPEAGQDTDDTDEKGEVNSSQLRPEEKLPFNDFDPIWRDTEPAHEAVHGSHSGGDISFNDFDPIWRDSEPAHEAVHGSHPNPDVSFDDFDPIWKDAEPSHEVVHGGRDEDSVSEPENEPELETADEEPAGTEPANEPEPEIVDNEPVAETMTEPEPAYNESVAEAETEPEPEPAYNESVAEAETEPEPESADTETEPVGAEPEPFDNEPVYASEPEKASSTDSETQKPRFIPEGMVLPEDDDDVDLTPHMKMPQLSAPVGPDGKAVKLKVGGNSQLTRPEETRDDKPRDDFDIPFTPGDDFDI